MLPPAAQTLLPAPPLGAHGGATPLAPGTFQVLTSLPFDTMVTSLPFDTKGPRHRLRARAQAFPHHPPSSPPTSDAASANTGFLESAHDLGAEDRRRLRSLLGPAPPRLRTPRPALARHARLPPLPRPSQEAGEQGLKPWPFGAETAHPLPLPTLGSQGHIHPRQHQPKESVLGLPLR